VPAGAGSYDACGNACRGSNDGACRGLGVSGTGVSACGGVSDDCGGLWASNARGNGCGGANDDGSVQGPGDARGGASGGARIGCEKEKVDRRVVNDGAHDSACGGTNGDYNG
jgi:hypothetical protein